jgi:hypothetical protein
MYLDLQGDHRSFRSLLRYWTLEETKISNVAACHAQPVLLNVMLLSAICTGHPSASVRSERKGNVSIQTSSPCPLFCLSCLHLCRDVRLTITIAKTRILDLFFPRHHVYHSGLCFPAAAKEIHLSESQSLALVFPIRSTYYS